MSKKTTKVEFFGKASASAGKPSNQDPKYPFTKKTASTVK